MTRKTPAEFLIVRRFMWYGDECLHRVAVAKTHKAAKAKIKEMRREMVNTYGGLIAGPKAVPGSTYEIWRAKGGWEQVDSEPC